MAERRQRSGAAVDSGGAGGGSREVAHERWGVELGVGFLTLLLWEAFTTCGAALRSQVRRLCSGARAPAAPAALEDILPAAGKADRRYPGGKGRLVAA